MYVNIYIPSTGDLTVKNECEIKKSFCDEQIAYFPCTLLLISYTSRKKTLLYVHNQVNKTTQSGGSSIGMTGGNDLRSMPLKYPQIARLTYKVL
jgi:hypothetical protein